MQPSGYAAERLSIGKRQKRPRSIKRLVRRHPPVLLVPWMPGQLLTKHIVETPLDDKRPSTSGWDHSVQGEAPGDVVPRRTTSGNDVGKRTGINAFKSVDVALQYTQDETLARGRPEMLLGLAWSGGTSTVYRHF